MKKQKLFIVASIGLLLLSGCSKTEKDISFDTEMYGTYSENINASNMDYQRIVAHTFNKDNSYVGTYFEKSDNKILKDSKTEAKIINVENINGDIQSITTDEKISYFSGKDSQNKKFYKYKNMLGEFYQAEIPKQKQFDLFLQNKYSSITGGLLFNKDGLYHYCTNYDNCTDDSNTFIKYKYKDNHIYQADSQGNWIILAYIVEDGVFIGEYTKDKE